MGTERKQFPLGEGARSSAQRCLPSGPRVLAQVMEARAFAVPWWWLGLAFPSVCSCLQPAEKDQRSIHHAPEPGTAATAQWALPSDLTLLALGRVLTNFGEWGRSVNVSLERSLACSIHCNHDMNPHKTNKQIGHNLLVRPMNIGSSMSIYVNASPVHIPKIRSRAPQRVESNCRAL